MPSCGPLAYACIDVGSNTTRLLVAEPRGGELRELASQRAFTRLGKCVLEHGRLSQEKIAETAAVVGAQAQIARDLGVRAIDVVGTAVVRDAPNHAELGAAVAEAAGGPMRVLSGEGGGRIAPSPSAAAPPRCAASWGRSSAGGPSSAPSSCSRAPPATRWPRASTSTPSACGSCPRASRSCTSWRAGWTSISSSATAACEREWCSSWRRERASPWSSLKSEARMGDVTQDMDAMKMPRSTPFFARGPALVLVALLVAGGALGLLALLAG